MKKAALKPLFFVCKNPQIKAFFRGNHRMKKKIIGKHLTNV
ncbi:hypothetical protein MY9_2907 [Bacillus sp. JS]|nr:hypothetical protein MY9_2907 [Bacillus sp. JS]